MEYFMCPRPCQRKTAWIYCHAEYSAPKPSCRLTECLVGLEIQDQKTGQRNGMEFRFKVTIFRKSTEYNAI
jgi:hypothetical protein